MSNPYVITWLKCRLVEFANPLIVLHAPQCRDQAVGHASRIVPESNQIAHASCGANMAPVICVVIQSDE